MHVYTAVCKGLELLKQQHCCEIPFRDCESGLFEIGLQGALNSISIPQLKEFLFALQNYFTFMGKIFDGTRY